MSTGGRHRSPGRHEALVLLGRRSDLLHLQGQADLPYRFLSIFDGDLESTAGGSGDSELDGLLERHSVVGIEADFLVSSSTDDAPVQRYRDNLAQKLAARRVALLVVLRDQDLAKGVAETSFVVRGSSGGLSVSSEPERQSVRDWQAAATSARIQIDLELDEARGLACFLVSSREGVPVLAARDRRGNLAELLELRQEGPPEHARLRSRWFSLDLARRPDATMGQVLADCAQRQERESLERVFAAWRDASARMQGDTQALTRLELVLVATRAIAKEDRERIRPFENYARTWVMTDRLRAGEGHQVLVRARHIWPDAVGTLLARLCLDEEKDSKRGSIYAWRSFVCGISADQAWIEKLRAAHTTSILEALDEAEVAPLVQRIGPFQPLNTRWVRPSSPNSDPSNARVVAISDCAEGPWVAEHRQAGTQLGVERVKLATPEKGNDTSAAPDAQDPERRYSDDYWAKVHSSPGALRTLAAARIFRPDPDQDLRNTIPANNEAWLKKVLAARRRLARDREHLLHATEELHRAQRFHVAIGWRVLIGSVVAAYAGFLALNVLRVLMTFSSGTWSTGIVIFALALLGGWCGALLPAHVERQRWRAATAALANQLSGVDNQHQEAVAETHALFRTGENVRQTIRITALQRRTTLLAERAWKIVCDSRDEVAREFQRRKLLHRATSGVDTTDRLWLEDRREWRKATVIRPTYTHDLDRPSSGSWEEAFRAVKIDFKKQWTEGLEREDPHKTGFLRASVLDKLVRELADKVGSRIEEVLLEQAEEKSSVAANPIEEQTWLEGILRALGKDASLHALLSVLDDGSAAQRGRGEYRYFHRDFSLAKSTIDKLGERISPKSKPVIVESLPLGGFAMLFHEVPLKWNELSLALRDDEHEPLPDAEATE